MGSPVLTVFHAQAMPTGTAADARAGALLFCMELSLTPFSLLRELFVIYTKFTRVSLIVKLNLFTESNANFMYWGLF